MKINVWTIFLAMLILLGANSSNAQNPEEATKILNQVKENVLSESSWFFDFELEVIFPELDPESISGTLRQDGKKIRADLGDQLLISNGETIWTYLREFNEVQVSNYEKGMEDLFLSPTTIVGIYESGEYEYQYSGKHSINGMQLDLIEFKPSNPSVSEYVKINLFLDIQKKVPVSIHISARNGTRYNLLIKNHEKGARHPNGTFVFNPADYPGVEIEDLRF